MSKCAYCGGNNFHTAFCEIPEREQAELANVLHYEALEAENARLTQKFDQAMLLVRDVTSNHRVPDSPDYNECDIDPCMLCIKAEALAAD